MAKTQIGDVTNLIQKVWAPLAMDELRSKLLLASLVNREYDGEIQKKNDTVKVSIIKEVAAESKTIGTDPMTFTPATVQSTTVNVVAEKLIIASVEIDDIVDIQSQLDKGESKLRESLVYGVAKKLNEYLYGKIAPIAGHQFQSVTDFNNTALLNARKKAAQAHWPEGWYGLVDPSYMNDLLAAQSIVSSDFVDDKPVVAGKIGSKRYGFNIFEDDSMTNEDRAILFHPDFLLLVMQKQLEFKISDKHSSKELGYVLSAHMYCGAALSPEGDKKHMYVTSEASGFDPFA